MNNKYYNQNNSLSFYRPKRGFLFFIVIALSLSFGHLNAGILKGTIKDSLGLPIPYVVVSVKNSAYGVNANAGGGYFLELKPGNYTIVFSQLGYLTQEHTVSIQDAKTVILDVKLKANVVSLKAVEISAKGNRDKGKEIMQKVIDKRSIYWNSVSTYQCKTYQKASLEKVSKKPEKRDSALADIQRSRKEDSIRAARGEKLKKNQDAKYQAMEDNLKDQRLTLTESLSEIFFQKPNNYKQNILAQHDFTQQQTRNEDSYIVNDGTSLTTVYGEYEMAPVAVIADSPFLLLNDAQSFDFNFYKNQIDIPAISNRPILSPAANTALLNYRFDYQITFEENGKKIHKIVVTPLFPADVLFEGLIYIEDSSWAIVSVNLSVSRYALLFCKEFNVIQDYEEVSPGIYLAVRREFSYTIADEDYNVMGNIRVRHSNYQVNVDFPRGLFNNEVKHYEPDAFEKDSIYWTANRTIELDEKELLFIDKADSMEAYFGSQEYLEESDSLFNRINIWSFLINGVGHRNSTKGYEFYIAPLTEQFALLGVGGLRYNLIGSYSQRFRNGNQFEFEGLFDYGIHSKDVKGAVGVGFMYQPMTFTRTFIRAGDFYERINPYASIADFFSLSNWSRCREFSIAQRRELVNGLFGEITFEYSDQSPIPDLEMRPFWDTIYSALASPIVFDRYTKTEVRVEFRFRFKQKYIIKKNQKLILGSKYPELRVFYRKGIPKLFNSVVNFDYLEIGSFDDLRLKRWGTSSWNILYGAFLNKKNLRTLENKFFRGSDVGLMIDPLRTFQLLDSTMRTSNSFFRVNYIHHFDGILGSKIPLLGKLKITTAVGGGILMIPETDFYHQELFAGLERVFRIWGQPLRFGIYAVTADNNLRNPDVSVKFGIGIFSPFTRRWTW